MKKIIVWQQERLCSRGDFDRLFTKSFVFFRAFRG